MDLSLLTRSSTQKADAFDLYCPKHPGTGSLGLMHNDVVKSDVHSTDTHGYSEMIFWTMHLLGFSYAPRIKNLKRR